MKLLETRVLYSIYYMEYERYQPGLQPDERYLKARFSQKSSYAQQILFTLTSKGYITFFKGFSIDSDLIKNRLGIFKRKHGSGVDLREFIQEDSEPGSSKESLLGSPYK